MIRLCKCTKERGVLNGMPHNSKWKVARIIPLTLDFDIQNLSLYL